MQKSLLGLLLLSLLTGCLSTAGGAVPKSDSEAHPWGAALRALDPADTANPAFDITAVYLRQVEDRLQIRVDLLDFQNAKDLSLDLNIGDDSAPGAEPFNIHIPSKDNPAHIALDPLLATVIIEIPLSRYPSRPHVDVSTPEDRITGLTLDGPVPAQKAPLMLTFYDTFATRFPAEALRSWDGAHTGPLGARHGLKHLLDAVTETGVPIFLLDLKKPENLSALDAMGLLPRIQQMEQEGLLILPNQTAGEALFGFSSSPFKWGGMESRLIFANTRDPSHIYRRLYRPLFSQQTYIPIATETDATRPTSSGPSLEVRRALLDLALYGDKNDLLSLGGSLRESTWGSPDMAAGALAYFASRPYVRILSAEGLINFPTTSGKPELRASPQNDALSQLETHYNDLTRPVLKFVENWQGSPLSGCNSDLDKDGQPECVLANDEYLAILDPRGARLTYLFAAERDTITLYTHQLIGPSWQVAVGLSNPSLWDPTAGEAADPGAYPGAFADADDPFKPYEPAIEANTVIFTSLDGTRTKTFNFIQAGIEVEYQTQQPVKTQIPLLVEPETRFTPGWAEQYIQEKTPGGIAWGLRNGPLVSVQFTKIALRPRSAALHWGGQAQGGIDFQTFNDSLSLLAAPEDPDFSYPPGHYLPFPLAVVEVEMQDGYFLRLERLP
jgi:hypothetical protein